MFHKQKIQNILEHFAKILEEIISFLTLCREILKTAFTYVNDEIKKRR